MNVEARLGSPTSVRIKDVRAENSRTRSLIFESPMWNVQPGQFVMVWVPGIDEIPMSISYWDPPIVGVTVRPIGDATQRLVSMSSGDWIGVRGPFGNGFSIIHGDVLVVGGGVGMAALRLLIYNLLDHGSKVTVLIAARTRDDLLFFDEMRSLSHNKLRLEVATEDGSLGFRGLATEVAENLIASSKFDMIYTCGPELMIYEIYRLARHRGISLQASLERYMKCGCGICGSCAMDPTGDLVCIDGPVFDDIQLARIEEFGHYSRDLTGRKKPFNIS